MNIYARTLDNFVIYNSSTELNELLHLTLKEEQNKNQIVLVIVIFGASWCPPCRALKQSLFDNKATLEEMPWYIIGKNFMNNIRSQLIEKIDYAQNINLSTLNSKDRYLLPLIDFLGNIHETQKDINIFKSNLVEHFAKNFKICILNIDVDNENEKKFTGEFGISSIPTIHAIIKNRLNITSGLKDSIADRINASNKKIFEHIGGLSLDGFKKFLFIISKEMIDYYLKVFMQEILENNQIDLHNKDDDNNANNTDNVNNKKDDADDDENDANDNNDSNNIDNKDNEN